VKQDLTTAGWGDNSQAALIAQRLYNDKNRRLRLGGPSLGTSGGGFGEDGDYGQKSYNAIRFFQNKTIGLVSDGVAGPRTLDSLGLLKVVDHRTHLIRQQAHRCWAAALKMVQPTIDPDAPIRAGKANTMTSGSLEPTDDNLKNFAQAIGWDLFIANGSRDAANAALKRAVQKGRVWVAGDIEKQGRTVAMHALAIAGLSFYSIDRNEFWVAKVYDPFRGHVYFMDLDDPRIVAADGRTFAMRWLMAPRA
jgi:hypothetical protein